MASTDFAENALVEQPAIALFSDLPRQADEDHTLMQTIARANRVFGDKQNGLIVDYVGVFRDLQKALSIYGSNSGGGLKSGETPVEMKAELVNALREAIAEALAFCEERDVDIDQKSQARSPDRWENSQFQKYLANVPNCR